VRSQSQRSRATRQTNRLRAQLEAERGGGGEIAGCASGIDRHVPKQRNQFAAAVISCAGRICHDAYFCQPLCGPGTAVGLPCECVCVRAVTVEQNDIWPIYRVAQNKPDYSLLSSKFCISVTKQGKCNAQHKAIVDIRLRPQSDAARWWVTFSICLFASPIPAIMCKHDVIRKQEVHNISQCHPRRTEPRPCMGNMHKNW